MKVCTRKVVCLAAVPFFCIATLVGQESFRSAPPEVERALRQQVEAFYSLYQEARFREAEQFVAEDSRDTYYAAHKGRILGYDIKNIEFSPDLKQAKVMLTVKSIVPMVTSKPLDVPIGSRWKLIDGEWYVDFTRPREGNKIRTPFGVVSVDPKAPQRAPLGGESPLSPMSRTGPPTLESLRNMYRVSEKSLRFPAESTTPVTKTVTLSNRSQGDLTVERWGAEIPGLEVAMEPAEIAPKEEMTISFTYQPEIQQLSGNYQLEFVVQPIAQHFVIELTF